MHKHLMEILDNDGNSIFAIVEDGSIELTGCEEPTKEEIRAATKRAVEKYGEALEELGKE